MRSSGYDFSMVVLQKSVFLVLASTFVPLFFFFFWLPFSFIHLFIFIFNGHKIFYSRTTTHTHTRIHTIYLCLIFIVFSDHLWCNLQDSENVKGSSLFCCLNITWKIRFQRPIFYISLMISFYFPTFWLLIVPLWLNFKN